MKRNNYAPRLRFSSIKYNVIKPNIKFLKQLIKFTEQVVVQRYVKFRFSTLVK